MHNPPPTLPVYIRICRSGNGQFTQTFREFSELNCVLGYYQLQELLDCFSLTPEIACLVLLTQKLFDCFLLTPWELLAWFLLPQKLFDCFLLTLGIACLVFTNSRNCLTGIMVFD